MLTFQNLVEAMEIDVLRRLALELLRRQAATFADIVSGELPGGNGAPDPDPDNTPEWCNCGHCMAMPTQEENKCCARTRRKTLCFKTSTFQSNCPRCKYFGYCHEVQRRCSGPQQ